MQALQAMQIKTSFVGKLISTTDTKIASLLNKRISIKRIVKNFPAHYEITEENTILLTVGRELYELKG